MKLQGRHLVWSRRWKVGHKTSGIFTNPCHLACYRFSVVVVCYMVCHLINLLVRHRLFLIWRYYRECFHDHPWSRLFGLTKKYFTYCLYVNVPMCVFWVIFTPKKFMQSQDIFQHCSTALFSKTVQQFLNDHVILSPCSNFCIYPPKVLGLIFWTRIQSSFMHNIWWLYLSLSPERKLLNVLHFGFMWFPKYPLTYSSVSHISCKLGLKAWL